jgi:alpha-glucosidase
MRFQLSEHPFLLAKGIEIPGLKRRRKVWAFVPKSYFTDSNRRFPIVYLNDGQNVFEGWKAPFKISWETHNTIKEFEHLNLNTSILIGIEHGRKHRKNEYIPLDNGYNSYQADLYSDFIANKLKPYVDKHLRTKSDREHTSIMGSSLGGISALYTGYKHQDVFGKIGVFSPSLWAMPSISTVIEKHGKYFDSKIYLSVGLEEGKYNQIHINNLYDTIVSVGYYPNDISKNFVPNGKHNEYLWQSEFKKCYNWLQT